MQPLPRITWRHGIALLLTLLILKVPLTVLINCLNYFPPNFTEGFLQGREAYFWEGYHWAFYAHLIAGPAALVLGLLLICPPLRRRWPRWHRRLGRAQGVNVLLLVAPSGLVMATRAQGGIVPEVAFAALALATAACVALGWRAAVKRRLAKHEAWMTRCFALLCSAVLIRVFGGLATVLDAQAAWIDPVAAWACWLLPLLGWELYRHVASREAETPASIDALCDSEIHGLRTGTAPRAAARESITQRPIATAPSESSVAAAANRALPG